MEKCENLIRDSTNGIYSLYGTSHGIAWKDRTKKMVKANPWCDRDKYQIVMFNDSNTRGKLAKCFRRVKDKLNLRIKTVERSGKPIRCLIGSRGPFNRTPCIERKSILCRSWPQTLKL